MAAGAVIALLVLALLAVVVYAWYLQVKLSKVEFALVRVKKLETWAIAQRKLHGEAASTPTRGHDALGQVPCEAVRGSQIGPGALGYARGTPATACRPAKKNEIFFLEKT